MPNIHDLLRAAGPGRKVLEIEDKHLASRLPTELKPFEKNFSFVPVEHDPFAPPEEAKPGAKPRA